MGRSRQRNRRASKPPRYNCQSGISMQIAFEQPRQPWQPWQPRSEPPRYNGQSGISTQIAFEQPRQPWQPWQPRSEPPRYNGQSGISTQIAFEQPRQPWQPQSEPPRYNGQSLRSNDNAGGNDGRSRHSTKRSLSEVEDAPSHDEKERKIVKNPELKIEVWHSHPSLVPTEASRALKTLSSHSGNLQNGVELKQYTKCKSTIYMEATDETKQLSRSNCVVSYLPMNFFDNLRVILKNANVCLNEILIEKSEMNRASIDWNFISALSLQSVFVQCRKQNNGTVSYIVPNQDGLEEGEIADARKVIVAFGDAEDIHKAIDDEERRTILDAMKKETELISNSNLSPTSITNPNPAAFALDLAFDSPDSTPSQLRCDVSCTNKTLTCSSCEAIAPAGGLKSCCDDGRCEGCLSLSQPIPASVVASSGSGTVSFRSYDEAKADLNNEESSSPPLVSSSDSSMSNSPGLSDDEDMLDFTALRNRSRQQQRYKPNRRSTEQVVSSPEIELTRAQCIVTLEQFAQGHSKMKRGNIVEYLKNVIQILLPGDMIYLNLMHCGVPMFRGGESCDCGGSCPYGVEALKSNNNCTLKALEAFDSYFGENNLSSLNCGHVNTSLICINGRTTDCPVKSKKFERCPTLRGEEVQYAVGIIGIFLQFCDSIGAKVFVFSLGGTTTGCEKIMSGLCERFPLFSGSENVTIHPEPTHHVQFTRTNLPYKSLVETTKTMTSSFTELSVTLEKHCEKCGIKPTETLIECLMNHPQLPLVNDPDGVSEKELKNKATLIQSFKVSILDYCRNNPDKKVVDAPPFVQGYAQGHLGEISLRCGVQRYEEFICRHLLQNMGTNGSEKVNSRSEAEKELSNTRRSETLSKRSEEEKELSNTRRSDAIKQALSKRSEEDKALSNTRRSDAIKQALSKRSEKDKALTNTRRSDTLSKRSEKDKALTKTRRSNSMKQALSNRSSRREPPPVVGDVIFLDQLDLSNTPEHVKAILREEGHSKTSRFVGVVKRYNNWLPKFMRNNIRYDLGTYVSEEEAGLIYAKVKYWYGIDGRK